MALLAKWSHQWNLTIRLFPGPSKTDGTKESSCLLQDYWLPRDGEGK